MTHGNDYLFFFTLALNIDRLQKRDATLQNTKNAIHHTENCSTPTSVYRFVFAHTISDQQRVYAMRMQVENSQSIRRLLQFCVICFFFFFNAWFVIPMDGVMISVIWYFRNIWCFSCACILIRKQKGLLGFFFGKCQFIKPGLLAIFYKAESDFNKCVLVNNFTSKMSPQQSSCIVKSNLIDINLNLSTII